MHRNIFAIIFLFWATYMSLMRLPAYPQIEIDEILQNVFDSKS